MALSSASFGLWRNLFLWSMALIASHVLSGNQKNSFVNAEVLRPYNLDYLDVDTMRHYLQKTPNANKDDKEDYDVAVLFYAQWCNNCHAFAPIWDKISRLIHAGSKEANMIMGLFDCEKDKEHEQVCNEAGVKHYPTVNFYSLSGQVFHGKQRKTEKNPYPTPQHGTTFGGNWQYGDAVYDWVRTMSNLSAWHRAGWGQKLRSLFIKPKDKQVKKKDQLLPLGIPPGGAATKSSSSTAGATTGSDSSATLALAEKKVEGLESKLKQYEELAVRSNVLMGAMLHPLTVKDDSLARVKANTSLIASTQHQPKDTTSNQTFTDAFAFLTETDGWGTSSSSTAGDDTLANEDLVLRSCVMEVSLDYCQRVTTRKTLDWIDANTMKGSDGKEESFNETALDTLEVDLLKMIEDEEPYCVLVETCIKTDYVAPECRPKMCPFVEPTACHYLTACFEPEIHLEYAKALKVETSLSSKAASSAGITISGTGGAAADDAATTSETTSQSKSGSGWGLA
mmetsp:Transcript_27073/g.74659  ORF Transcript_27073/g.74659 Transcript_27073/m.74659 type:complete len:509 (+) Transcript_27073:121-1647(+)